MPGLVEKLASFKFSHVFSLVRFPNEPTSLSSPTPYEQSTNSLAGPSVFAIVTFATPAWTLFVNCPETI